ALYVLDWHDADICGKEVLNKETGRIFRITLNTSGAADFPGRYSDLTKMTDLQLVQLQTSTSEWHARRARLILQGRAVSHKPDAGVYEQLRTLFRNNANIDWRLRAMWTLHVTGGFTPAELTGALNDPNEYIRAWAIQLLCEDNNPPADALAKF